MNDDIAIKVEHVTKTFREQAGSRSFKEAFVNAGRRITGKKEQKIHKGDFTALKNVNFEIKKGEFFGIVGRNGGGKSTLLKIIAGVYATTKGAVSINGKLTPFIELGVGFNPELSGRDNVFLNGALLGFTRKQMEEMYDDIVDFAELAEFMDTKLKNYSSGMQVRLAFSVAIRAESDILLIDEVLAVGDAAFQQKCFNYFEELRNKKKTVVFVSHDMSSVRRFCNSAIYISHGELVLEGDAFTIAEKYTEDNIRSSAEEQADGVVVSSEHDITTTIANKTDKDLSLKIVYNTNDKDDYFIGISVLNNGISLAESSTINDLKLSGSGEVSYKMDTTSLNPGSYLVATALFRLNNKELVAIDKKHESFTIQGNDISKTGPLRLNDSWEKKRD